MFATVEIQNEIALIRMDDGKANAINFEMVAALNDALDRVEGEAKAKRAVRKGTLDRIGASLGAHHKL